ncbi:MAG: hypothetical protein V4689_16630 [Verrucomicrobiota bacterium]
MKTFFKLLAIAVLCQDLVCPAAFADRRNGGGNSGSYRSSGGSNSSRSVSRPPSSGSSRSSMPRVQQSRSYSPQPSNRYVPRQSYRPPQYQPARPATRQQAVRPSSPQRANQLPQVSRKYTPPSRQAASRNPVVQPPRRNSITGKGSNATKPLVLPSRRDAANRSARPNTGKALALPGNRTAALPRGMVKNQPNQIRNAANNGRVIGSHPPNSRPGQNRIVGRHPDVTGNVSRPWWNGSASNINRNFRTTANWSTCRQNWGYAPWWNRGYYRPWYGSCWNWGWSRPYYNNYCGYNRWYGGYVFPGYAVYDSYYPVGWGLLGWSLGTLIYDSGYRTYYNPYPVSTVIASENVSYAEPIAKLAADTAPADETGVEKITRASESTIAESQAAFKQRNYLVALELADKAITTSPGDGALHEYRALILFALGKYGDAAGVLNPVIASGPGWDWTTMIALYDTQDTYTGQLQKLETWAKEKPDAADSHFLLGYHYMVCGHLDLATPQFELASKLMPSDGVSKELLELTKATARDSDKSLPAEAEEPKPAPAPVPLEKLTGTWVSTRDSGNTITLTFLDDGTFTWIYNRGGKINQLSGDYSLNDNGQLVLDSKESQMVATVALPVDTEMKFTLTGGPPADPGLDFKKR